MDVTLYRKSGGPWSAAVIGFLNKPNIPFEVGNVTSQPPYAQKFQAKTGQGKSPTLDIGGTLLADASVAEVAKCLETRGISI